MRIADPQILKPSVERSGPSRSVSRRIRGLADILGVQFGAPAAEERRVVAGLTMELESLRRVVERQRARIADLERLADEDVLAPVANRRAFERELSRQMARDMRHGTPSAVIYFDLNGLKRINDTHGHAAGDAAITAVADTLLANVRGSDMVARLGGDEFGLLLPGADPDPALEKARDLARCVEARPLCWSGHAIPLSISYGVHALGGSEAAEEALAAADRAMYAQKKRRKRAAASP